MSKITARSLVAPLNPWANLSTGVPNQAYSAAPATGTQPSSGTGFYDPSFATYMGQKFFTSDGRELALVANGGTALSAGVMVQSPAEITTAQNMAMTVPTAYPATAGKFQILVTNSSTVKSVNQFQGGFAIVSSGTGIGQMFRIASHQPAANGATFVVNLEDPIQTTLDATSKISLVYNPYGGISASAAGAVSSGVIVSTGSTATSGPVGVTLYNIAASTVPTYNTTTGKLTANGVTQYGLVTCHGPAGCLIDTVTAVGYPVSVSTAVAGAVSMGATTGAIVGYNLQTQTSAYTGFIYLTL
jgi:hypothetical protein